MKILFVSNLYPPHFIGGYEIACKDTVDVLKNNGHDCFVLTSKFKNYFSSTKYQVDYINLISKKTKPHDNNLVVIRKGNF